MIAAVIMAGGRGERFWPKSRKKSPKQLLDVFTGHSLIEDSLSHISGVIGLNDTYIITNKVIANKIKVILPSLPNENIIAEPMQRNTAAAIGIMAVYLRKKYGNPTILVLTADHLIPDHESFQCHASVAIKMAEKYQSLVTFGISPTYPETGFGYIKRGTVIEETNGISTFKIDCFEEKPAKEKAIQFVNSGDYYWNSGMFCWTSESILNAFERYTPELYQQLLVIEKTVDTPQFASTLKKIYPELPSIPIDKAIMEKADNALVVKSTFPWHDIGSWITLDLIQKKDESGNILSGPTAAIDTHNSIIISDKQLVATVGVDNLIIVTTKDAIMICPKDKAQDIKKIVQYLDSSKTLKKYT